MESTQSSDIILIVIVGCSVMTLLACFIIFFIVLYRKKVIIQKNEVDQIKSAHQQELLRSTLEVEEKERARIAKNIHDDLGALISILRLNNSRTTKNVDNKEILTKIASENNIILNKTSESMRSISQKLASPTLAKLGYTKALKELAANFDQTGEIKMSFTDELTEEFELDTQKSSHLFRASQEVVNNIVKHDQADEIHISIFNKNQNTFINFEHTGKGINDNDIKHLIRKNKGLGLSNIQNRLDIIGASIQYKTENQIHPSILITYPNDEKKD